MSPRLADLTRSMQRLGQHIEGVPSGEERVLVCLGDKDIFVAKMRRDTCGTRTA